MLCHRYRKYLLFYKRYIDDGFGIWDWDGSEDCKTAWSNFDRDINNFGSLKWTVEALTKRVDFLDLTLTMRNGKMVSTLFEKKMNLYLYLPPNSAHPPGVLKGLIAGQLLRILRLTSDPTTRKNIPSGSITG